MKTYKLLVATLLAMGAGTGYADFTSLETRSFTLQESNIEQTALQANVAAGTVSYGSGISVNQTAHVDSDARPATSFTLHNAETEIHTVGLLPPIIASGESESRDVTRTNSGVPGSASVTNNFTGQNIGGASAVNSVSPLGTVTTDNATANNSAVLANQLVAANGNANASGGQIGGVQGSGSASGLAMTMHFTENETFNKAVTKGSLEYFNSTTPVIAIPSVAR